MPRALNVFLSFAALAMAALAAASAAPAAVTPVDTTSRINFADLTANRVVWIRPERGGERLLERRGGRTRTLAFFAAGDPAGPWETRQMSVSDQLVVVYRTAGADDGRGEVTGFRSALEAITRDGRIHRLIDCPDGRCACQEEDPLDSLIAFDVDGTRFSSGGMHCDPRPVEVLETRPKLRRLFRLPRVEGAVQIAGPYVAWSAGRDGLELRVRDRRGRGRVRSWRPPKRLADRIVGLSWELDRSGRLAVDYFYATSGDDRHGFGVVDPRTRRLRLLTTTGRTAWEWAGRGRLVFWEGRRFSVHDTRTGRTDRFQLPHPARRALVDADARCLLYYRRRTPLTGALELEPAPGGEPSRLCPR